MHLIRLFRRLASREQEPGSLGSYVTIPPPTGGFVCRDWCVDRFIQESDTDNRRLATDNGPTDKKAIPPFLIMCASYVLARSFHDFPNAATGIIDAIERTGESLKSGAEAQAAGRAAEELGTQGGSADLRPRPGSNTHSKNRLMSRRRLSFTERRRRKLALKRPALMTGNCEHHHRAHLCDRLIDQCAARACPDGHHAGGWWQPCAARAHPDGTASPSGAGTRAKGPGCPG